MKVSDAIVARYTCKEFRTDDTLDESGLRKILALTQRAPTCFNSQGWVAVVVRRGSDESNKLIQAAFEGNQKRIRQAAATLIFCADLEPTRNLDRLGDLSVASGYDKAAAIEKIGLPLKLVAWHVKPLNWLVAGLKSILFPILGLFQPVMTAMVGESTRTWTIKQAMFPVSTFLLAATEAGWATSPMEGFDSGRAREAVGLPRRYSPTVLVALGTAVAPPPSRKKSLRFEPSQVFFDNHFTQPLQDIEPAVSKPDPKKKEN